MSKTAAHDYIITLRLAINILSLHNIHIPTAASGYFQITWNQL